MLKTMMNLNYKGESMEELREKLGHYINTYGINDKRTVKLSQELDKYVVEEQRKYGNY